MVGEEGKDVRNRRWAAASPSHSPLFQKKKRKKKQHQTKRGEPFVQLCAVLGM